MTNNKQQTEAIIGAILTMVVFYLLGAFAIWDLNAKHWSIEARVMYAIFSPVFSIWVYAGIRLNQL
jgi:hypothetical protein